MKERVAAGMGCIGVCAGGYALIRGDGENSTVVQLVNADLLDGDHWARGVGSLRIAPASVDAAPFQMQCCNGPL